jgi:uncharacterized YigZ family protein
MKKKDSKEKGNKAKEPETAVKKRVTLASTVSSEMEERKSLFIGHAAPVRSEEEARAFIDAKKKEFHDATHNVYAYILNDGATAQYSDDGEPQGTAGMPILEVLKNKKLFETAVAVVRYFGGIKLGAGGLVRAYSSSASENLAGADIRSLEVCRELFISVDYTGVDGVQKYLAKHDCNQISVDYGEKVSYLVAVKKVAADEFKMGLIDYMQGKIEVEDGEEYYAPFSVS